MRRLAIALSSSAVLAVALAVPVLGHHVVSIGCDEDLIEVVANVFGGHTIIVTIDGEEVMNEAVPGGDANHTYTFSYDGGEVTVEVTILDGDEKEDFDSEDVNCHEPEGEPGISIEKSHDPAEGSFEEGDTVTYRYLVENTGEVDLDFLGIQDFIFDSDAPACGFVEGEGWIDIVPDYENGSADDDAILEPGEIWAFKCSTDKLPVGETTNVACAAANVWEDSVKLQEQDPDVSACDTDTVTVIEGNVGGGTGTPAASLPNSAVSGPTSGPIATLAFGLLLLSSLGALAFVNVRSTRRR